MIAKWSLLGLIPERNGARGKPSAAQSQAQARHLLELARLEVDAALAAGDSRIEGLDAEQVEARLETFGRNIVGSEARTPWFVEIARRVVNPLNLLLLALAVVSILTSDLVGASIMTVMVAVAVIVGYVQESKSSRAVAALRSMVSNTALVRRRQLANGRGELPIEDLVPGDVVHLAAGDMIPADLRLLAAKDLFINQSSLTGESMPVEKFSGPDVQCSAPMESRNLCFMGSNVISGSALGLVVATGRDTTFGALASALATPRAPSTSFDRGLRRFVGLMLRFIAVMVPLVFLINGVLKDDWLEALMFSIAVAVGLTPEMLPAIVTFNLAKGALAMARKDVIVKRLPAIQNFGAIDVLCTDKTGTLTQDKVILERHVDAAGGDDARVLELAFLNSHYQTGLRNLLDNAVLTAVDPEQTQRLAAEFALVDEMPFDFERRRMSVVVRDMEGRHMLISKGAVAEMLAMCAHVQTAQGPLEFDADRQAEVRQVAHDLNADGFRVIAVGMREMTPPRSQYARDDERELTLFGFMAFLDPPKESAAAAIAALTQHGIAVKILTGDNDVVARHVCRHVGIGLEHVLTGPELDALDDAQLTAALPETQLFARLNPQQKVRVIETLRAQGHVVGFLGDGINDGPALRAADVGISVDSAVDIAKESADIILLEKSLAVLEEGVQEGRRVFGNILKYIKMTASSNFGNVFSVIGASVLLPFLPMAPIQLLINNLMYDLSMTTIATDNVDDDFVATPRRWEMGNIARYMFVFGPVSSLFDYVTFGVMWFFLGLSQHPVLFQTGWFVESLLSQTLIVYVIRTARVPFLQSNPSLPLLVSTLGFCLLGILLPISPLAGLFGFAALPHLYWLYLIGILVVYMLLAQGVKMMLIRRIGLN
ncbi:magnesium-translocating P-type ATPase [Metallibacterium sp.]|nr:magnesium-translocating P-type ATPase [Metallibacterium sp.]